MLLNPVPKSPMERVEEMAEDMETTYKLRPRPGADMEQWYAWLADLRCAQVHMIPDIRQSNADKHLEWCEQPPGHAWSRSQRANPLK